MPRSPRPGTRAHAALVRRLARAYDRAIRAEEAADDLPTAWRLAAASERALRALEAARAGRPHTAPAPRTARNLARAGLVALATIGQAIARATARSAALVRARAAAAVARTVRTAARVTRRSMRRAVLAIVALLFACTSVNSHSNSKGHTPMPNDNNNNSHSNSKGHTPMPNDNNNNDNNDNNDLPAWADELATGPSLPEWAERAIDAMRALITNLTPNNMTGAWDRLSALVEPLQRQPEGHPKAAVRAELTATKAAIRAYLAEHATSAPRVADATPTPPATVRQPIPVVPVAEPVAAEPVAVRTHNGEWSKIRTVAGEPWGAYVAAGADVRPGDVVWVRSARRPKAQRKIVAAIAERRNGWAKVTLIEEDATPVAEPVAEPVAPVAEPVAEPVALAAESAQEPPDASSGTNTNIEADLTAISGESVGNAAVQGAGSLAGGQLRIVGFATAEGYVTALAHGVKAATAESYKATLANRFGFTPDQIAALTVTVIPESTLPAGPGITHVPTGKNYADMTRAERQALSKIGRETRAKVSALLQESDLIAGAVAAGSMLQVSWVGGGTTTLGDVRAALAAIGREDDAPKSPSPERHAGRAVESLRGRDLDTTRLPSKDLPEDTKARWLVGRKLTGRTIAAGDAYGRAILIVDLKTDGTLACEGDQGLAGAVRAHYTAATGAETLRSEDLTTWLGAKLRSRHFAVKRGAAWYVPAGEADAARALSEAIEPLWGDHERIPVTTGADLMRSLTRGLADELHALVADYNKAHADAVVRAGDKAERETRADFEEKNRHAVRYGQPQVSEPAIVAACASAAEHARAKAQISPTVGARMLATLAEIAAKVTGYRTVIGDAAVTGLGEQIAALEAALLPTCTPADQRASMLELDGPTK